MKLSTVLSPLLWIAVTTTGGTLSFADERPDLVGGQVLIPDTSIEHADHIGRVAHTNTKVFVPVGGMDGVRPPSGEGGREIAPGPSYFYETPASLGCVYGLTSVSSAQIGCNPTDPKLLNPSGGAKVIAIVDAYDYPTAFSDLQIFSAQFGLQPPTNANFQVVYATGTPPKADPGWGLEAGLDIEWAHAMAPQAYIYLVEAASSSYADLLTAVNVASNLVAKAGGGEVSMSWGGSEFSFERFYDGYFTKSGVVYFAAAGDSAGTIWPSTSPNVVSTGGTSNSRDANGNLQAQLAWSSTGGGPSKYESRPSYQSGISQVVGSKRGTPDVAADADPNTGVWVYNVPYCNGWCIVGGTSVAAPVWSGIVNAAGQFSKSSQVELATVYSNLGKPADFTDITQGSCGPNKGYLAGTGWDFCTGAGSAFGRSGK
jgi:subtilase family serine protease